MTCRAADPGKAADPEKAAKMMGIHTQAGIGKKAGRAFSREAARLATETATRTTGQGLPAPPEDADNMDTEAGAGASG